MAASDSTSCSSGVESVLFDVHLRISNHFPDGVLLAKFLFVRLADLTDIENALPSCHVTILS